MGAFETVSALSDLLNSQPVTARQAADIAEEKGIELPYGTLSGYWAGKHGRPTAATLKKLAQVVPQLSEEQLQKAAWSRSAPLGPYQPPEEAMHLTEWQRRALNDLIKSVAATTGVRENGLESETQPPASTETVEDEKTHRPPTKRELELAARTEIDPKEDPADGDPEDEMDDPEDD